MQFANFTEGLLLLKFIFEVMRKSIWMKK